jgi:hypothetical protein
MTKREFFCNLCGVDIEDLSADYDRRGIGVRFNPDGSITEERNDLAEHHICNRCIRAVRELQRTF